ncbi:MAG: ATP-binding protein [bacterium]
MKNCQDSIAKLTKNMPLSDFNNPPADKKTDLFVYSEEYRKIYNDYKFQEQLRNAQEIFKATGSIEEVNKFCRSVRMAEQAQNLLKQSKINKRFLSCTFDNYKTENNIQLEAHKKAKAYAGNIDKYLENGTNLIICGYGSVGTGKTHLANAIARELMTSSGIPCKVIRVDALIKELKQTFSIKEFVEVEVLIIDDLGKEIGTDWVTEQIDAIVNARYERMKPTIITTENDIDTLEKNYNNKGRAVISRLTQDFFLIKLNGEDYRKKR